MTLSYVLITPARNEEEYIELTIRSVISLTVLPAAWVIVSDGSTDRTDEIVKGYLPAHPWMQLLRNDHALLSQNPPLPDQQIQPQTHQELSKPG